MGATSLLVAFDALGPETLAAMIDDGVMPNAAALRDAADCALIENYDGLGAGAFWPSSATGATPGDHGRCFRLQFDPESYGLRFRDDATEFPVEAFWNRFDDDGYKVAVIDYPHAPMTSLSNGFHLDNWLAHDPTSAVRSFPESFAADVTSRYGADPWPEGAWAHVPTTVAEWRDFIAAALSRIEMKTRFGVDQLRAGRWDLFVISFSEAHDIGHYALHLSDPAHPAYDAALAAEIGDPMRQVCAAHDRALGALKEAAGEDAAISLLGGPGMTALVSGNPMMDLITRRLEAGDGAKAQVAERAQEAYRARIPLWLRRALSPYARRLLRKPPALPELARRRFFAVAHTDNSGGVRVNLKGRERHGVIEPGVAYDDLLDEITAGLMDIRNAETGAPIVERVVRTRQAHAGALADNLPDLFVVWRRDTPFDRITSPKIGDIENKPIVRTGDHTPNGFLWSAKRSTPPTSRNTPLRPHEAKRLIEATVLRAPVENLQPNVAVAREALTAALK